MVEFARTEPGQPRKRKKKKLPKIISLPEVDALLAATSGTGRPVDIRNRAILEVLYRAGLRVSEVCALKPRDVDRAAGIIHLYDAKGGDGTSYFDPDRVRPHLDAWLFVRDEWLGPYAAPDARLFVRPDGKPVNIRYVQRLVKKLKEQVGIQGICTPHVLRHTYATELLGEGFTIHEVQVALRHANIATTATYLHVRDESLRLKMNRRGKEHENEHST